VAQRPDVAIGKEWDLRKCMAGVGLVEPCIWAVEVNIVRCAEK
jgi:uncharacterized membrane protein YpjA